MPAKQVVHNNQVCIDQTIYLNHNELFIKDGAAGNASTDDDDGQAGFEDFAAATSYTNGANSGAM